MPMSPQTVVFGIQAIMRLGNAARRAYEDKVIDAGVVLPNVDVANLSTPGRALQIVGDAIQSGGLPRIEWETDFNLVAADDISPAGLAAQTRIIDAALRLNAEFAKRSELDALVVLEQWSSDANRSAPLARIGLELADIALDYVGANPALFGVEGNGAKLVTSVAASLSALLPDPDDPTAKGTSFAAGAIRIFAEAGLRALDQNLDKLVDEAHLRDLARSTLAPLIDAVANETQSDQPWYDLRDTFLGPMAEAAIDALARNQVAILGRDFDVDSKVGALTHSVLLAVKDHGIADDLGKDGLVRVYRSVLDTVSTRPAVFFGDPRTDADTLTQKLLVNTAQTLKANSPPFDKALGTHLIASSFDTVSANAALLVNVNAGDWTGAVSGVSEVIIREVSNGLAEGIRSGGDVNLFQRLFTQAQGAKLLDVILSEIAATPGLVVGDAAPEIRALVSIVARAMAAQGSLLLSADDWLAVSGAVAREVAANPGRLIRTDLADAEQQLLFKLLAAVLNAAADTAVGARSDGNVLFGATLVEALCTVVDTAGGNAARALANVDAVEALTQRLADFAKTHKAQVGRREWLVLFRHHIVEVMDTGALPDLSDDALLALLERN